MSGGLAERTKVSDNRFVRGSEFIRKVEKLAKANGSPVEFKPQRGKGSHGTLYYNGKFTVVRNQKDELKTGTLSGMLKQLGIRAEDFE
jgi:mRNA interferase HicA